MRIRFILLILFLNLFACYLYAAKKPTKKQMALWEQIESSAKQEDMQRMVSLCKSLVGCSEMYDSLACLSRALLAEYALTTNQMNDVYDGYVFFREYSKQKKHTENALYYRDKLWKYYKQLLENDLKANNYEGLWFSDAQGDKNEPFFAFKLNANTQGRADIIVWEGCQIYKELSKYSPSNSGQGISQSSLILENIDNVNMRFLAQWGDQRIRDPKNNTALTMKGMQNQVKVETDAALASAPVGHFEEKLAIQVGSSLLQLLFSIGADLFAVGKVKSYALALRFGDIKNGVIQAEIELDTQIAATNQATQKEKRKYKFNLYKWYPHDEITFISGNKFFDQFRLPKYTDKEMLNYYSKVYPLAYDGGNKNKREKSFNIKKFNEQMYLDFACERIFHRMYSDTISMYLPTRDEMKFFTNSNEGHSFLVGWDKKLRDQVRFRAERLWNGATAFYQLNGSQVNGLRSGYYTNGEHHVCKVYDGVKQGKYIIYDYDGNLLGYNFYADGKKEGMSRWRINGGWLEKQWNSDKIKGIPVIYYDNGDEYTGEVNDEKPNGKGTMKYANGKIVSGVWSDGSFGKHQSASRTERGTKISKKRKRRR